VLGAKGDREAGRAMFSAARTQNHSTPTRRAAQVWDSEERHPGDLWPPHQLHQ